MTEPPAPDPIGRIWSPEARADLRAIDRGTAMQVLHCVDRYLANRTGDVKKLKPPRASASVAAATIAYSSIRKARTRSRLARRLIAARLTGESHPRVDASCLCHFGAKP